MASRDHLRRTPRRRTSCLRPTPFRTPTGASTHCWCSRTSSAAGCRAACFSVGTQPPRAEKAVEAIRDEFARMASEGLRGEALDDAKQQTLGQLMLSLESPTARMYRLASTAVYGESYRSLDEVLRTVEALTADEVSALAAEFFAPERQSVVSLGPNGVGVKL
ncbi:MAG: hypothetical protein DMD58_11075 [Gemmatimonadetes bacterium]|nr:MAG: hypothetical protein DMD58_11075 [Gemmatimonadota bacterium]